MRSYRKVRVDYFKVVMCEENLQQTRDKEFDLNHWIQRASQKSLEGRTFDYYDERARLDKFWHDGSKDLWVLCFARLRATNIPSRGWVDRETQPMILGDDEFIGEEANVLYDDRYRILALQRNRHSLGPSAIETYLNLLWGDANSRIYLRPIAVRNPRERIQRACEYRKFAVRFADIQSGEVSGSGPLKAMFDSVTKLQGVNAEVLISMGQRRSESLHPETVRELVDEVYENKHIISKSEVSLRETEDTKVEILDLFNDRIHDIIPVTLGARESLASEFFASKMIEAYECSLPRILGALERG